MKLQVFGATGMLGQSVVRKALAAGHTVLTGMGKVEHATIAQIEGDVTINCAGIVKQRLHTPTSELMKVNGIGPHKLAEAAYKMGSRLIHVSTDCVFSGGGPHYEHNVPDADDPYALSKYAGEITYGPHLTVRTSFVGFGARGLIYELQVAKKVTVSVNLLWSGHTVDTVADTLVMLATRPGVAGLLHMPGTFQNRYTLARDLKARWGLPAELVRDDGFVADRRLGSGRWDFMGLAPLPSFEQQLAAMKGPTA